MARKTRPENPSQSDDDDAPEVISKSASKANAKRDQKVLRDFEAEEKARQKAHNRERDKKLKERASVNEAKVGKRGGKRKAGGDVALDLDLAVEEAGGEDDEEMEGMEGEGSDDEGMNSTEARMLRAMKDAAEEADESEDGHEADDAEEFEGFRGLEGSHDRTDDSELDDDADMSSEADSEALLDEDDTDGDSDEDMATLPPRITGEAEYLDDAIFAEAFASQKSQAHLDKKDPLPTKRETLKKRRRKPLARAKDLVVGGRTIRTLAPLSDPKSQSTARTLPPARARKFVDVNLAIKGKQAARKAKLRGWERRPANIGVMKREGAPRGFVRQAT